MNKTVLTKNSDTFKISTDEIKAEFCTDSRSVINRVMKLFNITYRDTEHLDTSFNSLGEINHNIYLTKDECVILANSYGHERKRTLKKLIAKLEGKYYQENETINTKELALTKITELTKELNKWIEILNS